MFFVVTWPTKQTPEAAGSGHTHPQHTNERTRGREDERTRGRENERMIEQENERTRERENERTREMKKGPVLSRPYVVVFVP